jgi:protein SPA2
VDATVGGGGQTATSGMVIPSKSTIAEEDIEVPYGREARESTFEDGESPSTAGVGSPGRREREREDDGPEPETGSESGLSPKTPQLGLGVLGGGLGGLSGLSARLREVGAEEGSSPEMERAAGGGGNGTGRAAEERMRREYEGKIDALQSQIRELEREVGDAQGMESRAGGAETRVMQLEDELANMRQVCAVCLSCLACIDFDYSVRISKVMR